MRHRHRHWKGPRELRAGIRQYYGARLHRRLFLWFGMTIFVTLALVAIVTRIFWGHFGTPPPKGLVFVVLPAFVLFVISGKIARRIGRPLHELVDVATDIGRGNLDARATFPPHGFDEVGRVAHAINQMAARIKRQIAGQNELLAAVSHELRTPLARLRVLLDIARERGATEATFAEWERELHEMDQLVGELLASARLDFQALSRAPLDAVEVARRALERAGEPADRLTSATPSAPFSGDPTLLSRALANLLDNAHRHGKGLVRLEVASTSASVSFAVEDAGPGLAPDVAARIFEPASGTDTAADAAVAPARSHTSLGLGLVLVGRIARAHGGRARCEPRAGGGTRMVLELPIVTAFQS